MGSKERIYEMVIKVGFFQVDNIVYEYDRYVDQKKHTNKPIGLTIENWDKYKDEFIKKRFKMYSDHLTNQEKTDLEIDYIDKLENIQTGIILFKDFKILSKRYKQLLKDKEPHQQSIKHPFKNAPKQYCIIAQLLATNEIQIIDKEYKFKNEMYSNATQLNEAINEYFKPDKEYNFIQYLNNFKDKDGDKYLLNTKDINNNRDKKKLNTLRVIKNYFKDDNIEVINKDFKQILKEI